MSDADLSTKSAEPKTPIAIFVSGGGRTLAHLLHCMDEGVLPAQPVLVVASKRCMALERARGHAVPTVIPPPDWTAEDVGGILEDAGAHWGVLAGYIRKLPIPDRFADRIVNIHPALLPAHGGQGMYGRNVHEAVLKAGDQISGCTVHLANAEYDRGPILSQAVCAVHEDDTPDSLAARVFELELELYPATLKALFTGTEVEERFRAGTLRDSTNQ